MIFFLLFRCGTSKKDRGLLFNSHSEVIHPCTYSTYLKYFRNKWTKSVDLPVVIPTSTVASTKLSKASNKITNVGQTIVIATNLWRNEFSYLGRFYIHAPLNSSVEYMYLCLISNTLGRLLIIFPLWFTILFLYV